MNIENDILPEDLELVENYLLLQMDADQRTQFEQRLQQDEVMALKVEELNSLFNGIKQAAQFEKVQEWHKAMDYKKQPSITARIIQPKVWMIAATILVCCVAVWLVFFSKNKEEQLFAKYYKPDFGLVTAMSATDHFAFDKAMIDYKSGNYKLALSTWQQMLVQRPGSDTLHYFIGSSYMGLHDYAKASENFKKVVAIKQSPFLRDAYWYLGLASLQLGNTKEAAAYISQSDHQKKAALLNELKR